MESDSAILEPREWSPIPAENRSAPLQCRILGTRVDILTRLETYLRISQWSEGPHQIVTANTLMILEAENDAELRRVIDQAALVVPESRGVRWATERLQPDRLPDYIPGIDLMASLCDIGARSNHSVFLLGAKPGVATLAGAALTKRFPGLRIVGTQDGFYSPKEEQKVIAAIRAAAPHYLFVGLSMPEQEKWIARHAAELNVPVMMGVGGSFDVWSGRLPRAPLWMRNLGLEWLFRVLREPSRWRRAAKLPVFVFKILFA